jgi:GTP-binding protein HflX
MFRVALVGYTNAGKSTLMNTLANAEVFVENLLFATLDTTVRQIELSPTLKILLSDTVGFIRKLPPQLIASFTSTLAEVLEADLLLHVVDVTHPNFTEHISVVNSTLEELKANELPTILAFNKIDAIQERETLRELSHQYKNAIFISAQRGINIEKLKKEIAEILQHDWKEETLVISQANNRLLAQLHDVAEIVSKEYEGNDIIVKIRVQKKVAESVEKLLKRKRTVEV